jgi:two-component system, chemotaxis family, chemotaxis protein CheY
MKTAFTDVGHRISHNLSIIVILSHLKDGPVYNYNIVIIDDDHVILELLGIILEDMISGEIVSFSDSNEALAYIKSDKMRSVSLVICDWLMPDVSGLDILAALRQQHKDCPFLMVTGNATQKLVVDAMRLGASDFIVKPFVSSDLSAKVERLIHDVSID